MDKDGFQDYSSAEVTLFWTAREDTGEKRLIFAVTELMPENQLPSPPLGTGETEYLSHRLGKNSPLQICGKRFFCPVPQALDCFRGMDWSALPDAPARLGVGEGLRREPGRGLALVLSRSHVVLGNEASNLSMVLPNRPTSLRACGYLETDDTLSNSFSQGERNQIVKFVRRHCGVDLETYGEFLGASILCMQNPLLWGIRSFGTDTDNSLHLLLLPRDGRSPVGMRYMLRSRHSFGVTDGELREVDSEIISFPWPAVGREPELYLWDGEGTLLEARTFSYMGGGSFRSTFNHRRLPNGVLLPEWPEPAKGRGKKRKELMAQYEETRMYQRLEKRREFFYFRAGEERRAAEIIGMLLAPAMEITICDMYLDAEGLARMVSGWIKCWELTLFVSKKWMNGREKGSSLSRREALESSIQALAEGKKVGHAALYVISGGSYDVGFVHDRFLILDERVYCLGASLNGFGARDTVLFRSPNPQAFTVRVKEWKDGAAKLEREWGEAGERA